MDLSVTTTHDPAAFDRLRPEWEALQAESAADSIYLTWDWITLWWEHFGGDSQLWLLEARDSGGQLVGLGPLMRTKVHAMRGLGWWQIEFIGTPSPCEHLDFLTRRGAEEAVARAFMQHFLSARSQWDSLAITRLPEHSPTLAVLRAWEDIPWQEDMLIAPMVVLDENWEAFAKNTLSHDKRKDQKKVHRNIEAAYPDGRWQWRRVTDPAEVKPTLDTLIALHQALWTSLGEPGAFAGPYEDFFHAVAQRFIQRGWLELSRIELDGKLAGAFLGYCYRDRFYDFVGGIDYSFGKLQLGHLMTELTMIYEMGRGVREHDFLWGTEEYKYRWGAKDRHNITLLWLASPRARLMQDAADHLRAGWGVVKTRLPAGLRDRIKSAAQGE